MVVVGCLAGRAGGREKGGVGVGMGGVCGWGRREEEGGRRGGRGREREGNLQHRTSKLTQAIPSFWLGSSLSHN